MYRLVPLIRQVGVTQEVILIPERHPLQAGDVVHGMDASFPTRLAHTGGSVQFQSHKCRSDFRGSIESAHVGTVDTAQCRAPLLKARPYSNNAQLISHKPFRFRTQSFFEERNGLPHSQFNVQAAWVLRLVGLEKA
jgi:hypothetical protein